jgi:hypothetical protein
MGKRVRKRVKAWSEDRKFTHTVLSAKRSTQSMDWRRANDKDSHEYECWKKVTRSGIDQLRMLVMDNADHEIVARARKPMTPAEWNTVFACANMQAVYEIEPVDLTVTLPDMKGRKWHVLVHKQAAVGQAREELAKAAMKALECKHAM